MALSGLGGKVAVVTGAGGGIGAASARRLAAEGARVVVVDIDGAAARAVAEALPGEAFAVQADVSREEDVDRYTGAAVDRFGRIDLHHLNAGIFGTFARLPDLTVEEFDRVIGVNLRGPFLGLRAAFRRYEEQGGGGAVVVTGSIAGLRGSSDLLPYQTSKHGVGGLVHGCALYGGPLGVRVNAVAPGLVPTGLFAGGGDAKGGGGDMERRGTTTPMRRVGTPGEIAGVVAFLLSDDAGYVTGEIVSADGGASVVNTVRPSGGAGAWDPGDVS
ncbi:SDR family NAD(P)-dependent oxidoreductase [Actinomadura madurae]|uniref:SDR family NAD(P)-dependent oxidoreductase n=1 Tax=Actinomadura madurae TaxID=1993 RepID=UPI0020D20BAC|nr:SDR family oxidoreductase [Actinomadura madurae]MCP9955393.1 SDR family oxidoreductase [Actinomadura madurae]MCP9984633.1 SDR family oxidoreductase [Actinomadura madurae]MCQ0003818.1 SDR family oxidoreductase [Actinomadura madurae]MCQ0020824.1 SDR family oxidoreductase [Actinomadura madurae]